MAMPVPHPLLAPEDEGHIPERLRQRVEDSLSEADKRLLDFMRKHVRIELGEGARPVLAVIDASISFEPLNILWCLNFGLLTLYVDEDDRVYLVKTDITDQIREPCKPKKEKMRRHRGAKR